MTDSFGARLRRERERRQVSIADIAARTKIKGSLFEGLERDDVSRWPSGIFRRSFMRAYAGAIGLDAEATVREFLEQFPDPAAPAQVDGHAASAPGLASPKAALFAAAAERIAAPAAGSTSLRLTLVETGLPFTGGRFLADAKRRWAAAVWDLGSLVAVAVSIFVLMDSFWMPLGVTALCYYVGGILFLGNSPGVCLFAPKAGDDGGESRPARVPRHRPVDVPVRTAEQPMYRASRFRADRHREVGT
jgi:transcriptional regulator with XRE-family HTH domain